MLSNQNYKLDTDLRSSLVDIINVIVDISFLRAHPSYSRHVMAQKLCCLSRSDPVSSPTPPSKNTRPRWRRLHPTSSASTFRVPHERRLRRVWERPPPAAARVHRQARLLLTGILLLREPLLRAKHPGGEEGNKPTYY